MDILRKELNEIYQAQHLDRECLDPGIIDIANHKGDILADSSAGCAVITDASCDKCYIHARALGSLMDLSNVSNSYVEVNSSDEDEIYNRIHPEDLVEKRMLEYEFFKSVQALPSYQKTDFIATCRLRMRDHNGNYRIIDNSTQITALSPAGNIWLILCRYDLSPDQSSDPDGIAPRILNIRTGNIESLTFKEKKSHILTGREKEILRLIQNGRPSKQIADVLGISVNTVNRHRQNIIEKLSVGNSVEAVTAASAMGLI